MMMMMMVVVVVVVENCNVSKLWEGLISHQNTTNYYCYSKHRPSGIRHFNTRYLNLSSE